jgi:pimeloyl-ACP methyl ester carboxylesterase
MSTAWWTSCVAETEVKLPVADRSLTATWAYPEERCVGAVVALHPSSDPSRNQFLFRALAEQLAPIGVAVLRYDRRRDPAGRDVPYHVQLDDAQRAIDWCRARLEDVPVGVWGFSQGAWVAMMAAAADPAIAFLALVGGSTVSPARQMRYGTDEQLRRAGYDAAARAELARLRDTYEQFQRGELERDEAQRRVDEVGSRPWFGSSWVPRTLPPEPNWVDMDFDPSQDIAKIGCPVLVFYGADEWIPVEACLSVWHEQIGDPGLLTIERLPGTGHHPTLDGGRTIESISPRYRDTLTTWIGDRVHAR